MESKQKITAGFAAVVLVGSMLGLNAMTHSAHHAAASYAAIATVQDRCSAALVASMDVGPNEASLRQAGCQ